MGRTAGTDAGGSGRSCSHTTQGEDGTEDEEDEGDGRPEESGTVSASGTDTDEGRAAGGVLTLRRSSMETATRKAPAGVPAVIQPHTDRSACARFAASESRMPPTRTSVGHDSRPVWRPVRLSRWRSPAAMTQVRSMQTAMAQAIHPRWPWSVAVSRMWVNDPAAAIPASTTTGPESVTAPTSRRITPPAGW
ncbi:hypothetical protein amrb99_47040 [Actinomadura sp. RB99]|nr:hypothetical protein [Actinomadura sp. RB99]